MFTSDVEMSAPSLFEIANLQSFTRVKKKAPCTKNTMQRILFTKFGCKICSSVVKMHKGQSRVNDM